MKINKVAVIHEAVEEISNKRLMDLSEEYLEFAKGYVSCDDNSCKREASRIVGNLAIRYPHAVQDAIPALLENAKAEGTVVRWESAYDFSDLRNRIALGDVIEVGREQAYEVLMDTKKMPGYFAVLDAEKYIKLLKRYFCDDFKKEIT